MSFQQIGSGLDGVRKEKKIVETKLNQLYEEKETIYKVIVNLEKELEINSEDREKAYEKIRELRKQLDEGVCYFTLCIQLQVTTFILLSSNFK